MNFISQILSRFRRTHLTDPQNELLRALLDGWTLKSHRTLDGQKAYRLHGLHGEEVEIADAVVDGLSAVDLIQSNLKFPAATYLLTNRGRSLAVQFRESVSK